jgi:hypothetical protein
LIWLLWVYSFFLFFSLYLGVSSHQIQLRSDRPIESWLFGKIFSHNSCIVETAPLKGKTLEWRRLKTLPLGMIGRRQTKTDSRCKLFEIMSINRRQTNGRPIGFQWSTMKAPGPIERSIFEAIIGQ